MTSTALLLMPWQRHRRFATWAVPMAMRHLNLYALGALGLGALPLWAALSER